MSEQPPVAGPSSAERLAEVMAWHGMARYADPDVLAAYVRPAASGPGTGRPDGEDGDPLRA